MQGQLPWHRLFLLSLVIYLKIVTVKICILVRAVRDGYLVFSLPEKIFKRRNKK